MNSLGDVCQYNNINCYVITYLKISRIIVFIYAFRNKMINLNKYYFSDYFPFKILNIINDLEHTRCVVFVSVKTTHDDV